MRKPISLKIVKARYTDSGDLYPPLIPLLRIVKIDPDSLRDKYCTKIKNDIISNISTR